MDLWWLVYPLLGVVVGFLAGLLGIGGGAVMVPVLTTLYAWQGFPTEKVVHLALGTSMAAIVVTAVASARAHAAQGSVRWSLVWPLALGVGVGSALAARIAALLPGFWLALFFSFFLVYVAWSLLRARPLRARRILPSPAGLVAVGIGIGAISTWVAIGGGSLTVPFLSWCNVPLPQAIGTSAALGVPIAVVGSLGYAWIGWGDPSLPPWTTGFIYWPAVLGIGATSVWTAPVGARWAHRLPVTTLRRIFAGVLLVLAAKMWWSLLR
ncbi:MAG: sulfite exporter TauE/SafE family protein [Hydrogenophilus sp.]|nr:sulfite exporter TauE/SafE family protein [Hydrogenophilus sp.]